MTLWNQQDSTGCPSLPALSSMFIASDHFSRTLFMLIGCIEFCHFRVSEQWFLWLPGLPGTLGLSVSLISLSPPGPYKKCLTFLVDPPLPSQRSLRYLAGASFNSQSLLKYPPLHPNAVLTLLAANACSLTGCSRCSDNRCLTCLGEAQRNSIP